MDTLDQLPEVNSTNDLPTRLPIQDVYKFDERRIIAGRIESGTLKIGDELLFTPSNKRAAIESFEVWNAKDQKTKAIAGESVGIILNEEIFIERGHIASLSTDAPIETNVFRGKVFWIGNKPIIAGDRLKIKIGTAEHISEVQSIENKIDLSSLEAIDVDRLEKDDIGEVVLADTVGFIRHLPHKLVEAFRATLQETTEADLLLHVIDSASDERQHNIDQVEHVLTEIEADKVPQIRVYNKIDLLEQGEAKIVRNDQGEPVEVWVSAVKRLGFELLHQAIAERLGEDVMQLDIELQPQDSKLRALLYEQGAIVDEKFADNGDYQLRIRMQRNDFKQTLARASVPIERFLDEPKEDWQR